MNQENIIKLEKAEKLILEVSKNYEGYGESDYLKEVAYRLTEWLRVEKE